MPGMSAPAPASIPDPTAGPAPDPNDPNANPSPKQVMITAEDDGTFTVQPMSNGQPAGDPMPAKSIDEAMQGASDALGATTNAQEGSQDEEAGESPDTEAQEDASGEPAPDAGLEEAKARYASKRGTRPKTPPSFGDYLTGGNPMAK